jgi:hypothetical protein
MRKLSVILFILCRYPALSQEYKAFYKDDQTIQLFSVYNSEWIAALDFDDELVVTDGNKNYSTNLDLWNGESITDININLYNKRVNLNLLTQYRDSSKGYFSRLHIAHLKRGKFRFNKCITLDKVYHEIISTPTFLVLKNDYEILFTKQNSVSSCEHCMLSLVNNEGIMLFNRESFYHFSNKGELLQESSIEKDVLPIFIRDNFKIYHKDNKVIYQNVDMIKEIHQSIYSPLFVLGFNSKYLIFFDNVGAWLIDYRKSTFSLRFLGSNVHEIEATEEKYYLSIDNAIYEVDW